MAILALASGQEKLAKQYEIARCEHSQSGIGSHYSHFHKHPFSGDEGHSGGCREQKWMSLLHIAFYCIQFNVNNYPTIPRRKTCFPKRN
jgi:hypothetical protein